MIERPKSVLSPQNYRRVPLGDMRITRTLGIPGIDRLTQKGGPLAPPSEFVLSNPGTIEVAMGKFKTTESGPVPLTAKEQGAISKAREKILKG